MVPVALVRENFLDHAIWTVAVVRHPVVADQHRHHSLELEYVESGDGDLGRDRSHDAFLAPIFFSYQQMEELEAVLVEVQADLAVQEVQEVPEVVQEVHEATDQEEHQGHQEGKSWR